MTFINNKKLTPQFTMPHILDEKTFPWIVNHSSEDIHKIVEIGFNIYLLAQKKFKLTIGNENNSALSDQVHGMHSQLQFMSNHFNDLRCELNDTKKEIINTNAIMQKTMNTSALKGEYGERCVMKLLQEYFPDDSFELTTQMSHSGDIHMHPSKKHNGSVMIEIKTYKNVVPTTEVNKFYENLERINLPLGLFISLTSTISKKHRLEISRQKGRLIVFIPNALKNPSNIMYGILVLQELYEFEKKSKLKLVNIENIASNIEETLSLFDNYINDVCTSYYDMKKKIDTIDTLTADIRRKLIQGKDKARFIIEHIKKTISREIQSIQKTETVMLNTTKKQEENTLDELVLFDTIESLSSILCTFLQNKQHKSPQLSDVYSMLVDFMLKKNIYVKEQAKQDILLYCNNENGDDYFVPFALIKELKQNVLIFEPYGRILNQVGLMQLVIIADKNVSAQLGSVNIMLSHWIHIIKNR